MKSNTKLKSKAFLTSNVKSSILVVDDHKFIHDIVTKIVESQLDLEIIGHASNGLEAVQFCENHQPDIILMDVVMPIMGGVEAVQVLRAKYPSIKIMVLSSFQDHESVSEMLKKGAVGYVTKSSLASDLVDIIRTVLAGKSVFSPEIMRNLLFSPQRPEMLQKFHLTEREVEVLKLLAEGMQNQQIAVALIISVSTVKFHKVNIFEKLGASSQSEALVVAVKNNLI
jgi:two-component system, NarL family, response regulator LiaR